jgi:GGDEF domain-containing protein
MRASQTCILLETWPGELEDLRRRLEHWVIPSLTVSADGVGEVGGIATSGPAIVQVRGSSPDRLADRLRAWRRAGRPMLAVCPAGDRKAADRAAELGADDIMLAPLDGLELRWRLDRLSDLASLWAEEARRAPLLARRSPDGMDPRSPARSPDLWLIGLPGELPAAIARALPSAHRSVVARPDRLASCPAVLDADLLVAGSAEALEAARACVGDDETVRDAPPVLVAYPGAPPYFAFRPPVDTVPLPVPDGLLRTRLRLALLRAEARRRLRMTTVLAHDSLIDPVTGLLNQKALAAYLKAGFGEDRPALLAVHANAPADAASRACLLARVGRVIAELTRVQDFAAHLGEGRFVVAAVTDEAGLRAVRDRLAKELERRRPGTAFTLARLAWP